LSDIDVVFCLFSRIDNMYCYQVLLCFHCVLSFFSFANLLLQLNYGFSDHIFQDLFLWNPTSGRCSVLLVVSCIAIKWLLMSHYCHKFSMFIFSQIYHLCDQYFICSQIYHSLVKSCSCLVKLGCCHDMLSVWTFLLTQYHTIFNF